MSTDRPRRATAAEIRDGEDRRVDINHPSVPPGIRASLLEIMQPGDQLWRSLSMSGRVGWLGLGKPYSIIEWVLLSADGELIEVFRELE